MQQDLPHLSTETCDVSQGGHFIGLWHRRSRRVGLGHISDGEVVTSGK